MDWKTGDTVCDPKNEVELPAIEMPEPCYSMAISPKTKGQDDKVAGGLARLNEEDISFTLVNNAETHQMVISGQGDIQVDVLCAKLTARRSRAGSKPTAVIRSSPVVPVSSVMCGSASSRRMSRTT